MDSFNVKGIYRIRCIGPDGRVKWEDETKNLIPNAGLNHILDTVLHGSTPNTTWYLGLKNAGTVAAADTLASHAGWTENVAYTGDRKEYIEAAASGQSITNAASPASFAINTDGQTIAGAFLASAATGTTGVLLSAGNFATAKSAGSGDTIELTYTLSATSS